MSLPDGKHIAIVEDDDWLRGKVHDALIAEGYSVSTFADAGPFMRNIKVRGLPHLAILDLILPSEHGFQLSEKLRALGAVPIIFMSSEDATETVVRGIVEYAEDYITKPFDMRELVARVRRVLSRVSDFSYLQLPVVEIDDWLSIDFAHSRILRGGEEAALLTPTEANLLHILVGKEGEVVASDILLARVWPFEDVYEDTLRVHMHRLRRKIEPDHRQPRYIETVRGVGYRFVLPAIDSSSQPVRVTP